MEIKPHLFDQILAPRISVLITTLSKKGKVNAAPFSFITPVSFSPPLLTFACGHGKDTLLNIQETKEFVVNLPPEEILEKLWICDKKFPRGVSEVKKAQLTEEKSKKVKPPRIKECFGWLECKLEDKRVAGDHVLLIGRIVKAEIKDSYLDEKGRVDVKKAKLLLHISGEDFAIAERIVRVKGQRE